MITPQQASAASALLKGGNPSAPGAPAQGNWYSQVMSGVKPAASPQPAAPTRGYVGNSIKEQGSSGIAQAEQGYQDASQAKNPIQETEAGMKELSGAVGTATAPLAPVLKPIGDVVSWLGEKIGNTKAAQDFVQQHPEAAQALSRIATDTGNTANVLGAVEGGGEAPEAAGAVKSGISDAAGAVKDTLTPKPQEAESAAAAKAQQLKAIASEWQKPTEGSTPAFNNARDVLAKDTSIPQFLAEQKANPAAHINAQDRFETADTAQALEDTAGKMSNETLRPSLQAADYSTPKTSVADIKAAAIKNANADKLLTSGEKETVIRNINKESTALSKDNPNGMGLTQMHDGKITYAGKGGYSPIKSASDNLGATSNRHIASAMQHMVEEKAPASIPVKDFNAYLGKYYKAADYLKALDGKKAPVSWGTSLARTGGKLIGLAVGSHIGGGGILSDVLGYRIGGVLEHAVEHMTSPARATFLRNLEVTNPKAFTQVQDYLMKQNSGANGMLRLPPATSNTPIPLGGRPDSSGVRSVPAPISRTPGRNPNGGQFMRVYESGEKRSKP